MLLKRMSTIIEVEIDHGAFKMKDDRAMPMRIAAYNCMEPILSLLGNRMDSNQLLQLNNILCASVPQLDNKGEKKMAKGRVRMDNLGIKDANQVVRTSAYRMLTAMCAIHPAALVRNMADVLYAILLTDLKTGTKKTKIIELKNDNRDEPIIAAVRLIKSISEMNGIDGTCFEEYKKKWVCDNQPAIKQLWDNL
jgi:hypothetical protein